MMGEIMTDIQDDVRSVVLNPGSGGVFEWSVNGDLVFSKASTGRYPEMKELKELIYAKLDA